MVLGAGLLLLTVALAVRLSRAPLAVLAANTTSEAPAGVATSNQRFCQEGETEPAGTTAVRLGVSVNVGPRVTVTVLSGARVLAQGTQPAGWTGEAVTIPVARAPSTTAGVDVCVTIGPALEPIGLLGQRLARTGGAAVGLVKVEYLGPAAGSWWSRAAAVARRMGLGRSPSGTWVAYVPLLLMVAAAALAAWLVLRELGGRRRAGPPPRIAGAQATAPPATPAVLAHGRHATGLVARRARATARRVPSAAWVCGAVAWLSAASWSVVSAPFQVPDEPAHFAYVQHLAETGTLPPRSRSVEYAPQEMVALRDLDHNEVRYNALHGTISSPTQQQRLEGDLAAPYSPTGGQGVGVAWSQPPLYYALQTIPYGVASGGNVLERLALLRLVSALMAGLTALFAYLFLREALPAAPWAWTVGGLGVALYPLVGFMSGAVNPDSMLCAVSAALFYCLARAFRRGLSPRGAVAIGVVTAVGFLTKLNFVGLVPGVAVALALLAWRAARDGRGRAAYRLAAVAAAIGVSPVCVYTVVNALSGHPLLGLTSGAAGKVTGHGSVFGELGYLWQFYLPRLPGMTADFPGLLMSRLWFDRTVGLYGWLDTAFPQWVYTAALLPAAVLSGLCVASLVAHRAALRRRLAELLAYAAVAVGLLVLIGQDSYLEYPGRAGGYAEPRYLLPLTVLCGAGLALAARGAGRRWGPAVGAGIVVLILGHDVFSQLLTVSRYYG